MSTSVRMRRDGGTNGQTSSSRSAVKMRRDDVLTKEIFLWGQQKKQFIMQSMEQMRMVSISSSKKNLEQTTKLLGRRSEE